ncbi:kinetochore protein nuf2 [Limosa lapponica baueri]|uniref:Kinetochore protein nuf2 n=1 Tax=Limosa lapponica baueri TaxID=1758121 RepID=A0A2I0UHT0_LIMLA|nr:kinetochore protein nuf2 [Limosa lapponica baueri]
MEAMTFPRYSPDDIVNYLRSHVLAGAEARNLVKSDVFGNPKPEVLHMIYMRILQKVYGIRLEHFYMTALQEAISQKKSDIAERTRKLNELKVTMAALKEEQEQLKSKIVESPEELKNYKELMKETVKKLKKSKQEVIEKYESYRDLVEVLPSCQLEVQLYQKKMERQGANVERLASVLSEVRNLEDQLESAQIELKKVKTDEMSLKRLVTAKHEKLSTAEIRIKKKREDVEQYKRTVFEYCNRIQEKRGAVYDKVTAIHKEIQQTRFKIQQLNENAEKEEMKAKEIYLNLKAGLEKRHDSLIKMAKSYAASTEDKVAELKKGLLNVQIPGSSS